MNNVANIKSEEAFIRVYLFISFFGLHCSTVMCMTSEWQTLRGTRATTTTDTLRHCLAVETIPTHWIINNCTIRLLGEIENKRHC